MRAAYRLRSAYTALVWLIVYTSFHLLHDNARAWDDVSWTAAGDDLSWSAGDNWSSLQMPTTGDRVLFTDVGASSTVGVTTSVLDGDAEIGSLAFANGVNQHHTIDLGGHRLQINDSLSVNQSFYGNPTELIRNGDVVLGSSDKSAVLQFGNGDLVAVSHLDLTNTRFDSTLDSLILGETYGDAFVGAYVTGGASGKIKIGSESHPGRIILSSVTDSAFSDSRVDFSRQESFVANLQELAIGVGTSGSTDGNLKLGNDVNISADSIRIGSVTNSFSSSGELSLGNRSVINTPSFEMAVNATGRLTSGSLQLGTPSDPVNFTLGVTTGEFDSSAWATFSVDGPFDASFGDVTMGVQESQGLNVSETSVSFSGGQGGDIRIGTALQRTNVLIGVNQTSTTADFSAQSSLTAQVHNFWVGTGASTVGFGSATLRLPRQTLINADSIRAGFKETDDSGASTDGTIEISGAAKLLADELIVGWQSDGSVNNGFTGSLALQVGEEQHPARLVIGHGELGADGSGTVDVGRDGRFDAVITDLIVGEAIGPRMAFATGVLKGGTWGTVRIGSPTAPGVFIVGRATGDSSASGTVDLTSEDRLEAHLDRLEVAFSELGNVNGTLKLPSFATIDAPEILVGRTIGDPFFSAQGEIVLGKHTVISTDRILVGIGRINGKITAPYDSELLLGSPNRPVDLTIAQSVNDNFANNSSTVDLKNAATTAYLGDVLIGEGSSSPNILLTARLSFGSLAQVDADRIVLAQGNANGTLDFQGGRLTVDEISKGTGNAQFNWTGGRIEIGQFGTEAIPFDLANTKQGTLAAADAFDAIHIYGNYAQGADATFEASEQLGAFRPAVISGAAKLAGTLDIQFEAGFHPEVGETFTILTASSIVGTFARVTGFLTGDTFLNPIYHSTYIELQAYRAGDSNLDGFVDGADYTKWAAHFLQKTDRGVADGDYNGDGLVNGADYILWADHFYVGSPSTVAAMAVPEPSTLALASLGILLMAAVGRGRQAN